MLNLSLLLIVLLLSLFHSHVYAVIAQTGQSLTASEREQSCSSISLSAKNKNVFRRHIWAFLVIQLLPIMLAATITC